MKDDLYVNLRPIRLLEGIASPQEIALQTAVYTRRAVERILRYAFDLARRRRKKLAHVTKSNALQYTAVMWDEVAEAVGRDFPDVQVWKLHASGMPS